MNRLLIEFHKDFASDQFSFKFAEHDEKGEQDFVGFILHPDRDNYYAPVYYGEIHKDAIKALHKFLGNYLEKTNAK